MRITSDQLSSPRLQGQAVRAVGKLVAIDSTESVQLMLAGPEGARYVISHLLSSFCSAWRPLCTFPALKHMCLYLACNDLLKPLLITGPPAVVRCPNGAHAFQHDSVGKGVYEVIGTLGTDGSLTEMKTVPFGENFDLDMYAQMATLSQQFPEVF